MLKEVKSAFAFSCSSLLHDSNFFPLYFLLDKLQENPLWGACRARSGALTASPVRFWHCCLWVLLWWSRVTANGKEMLRGECGSSHFPVLSGWKQITPQGFVVILFFWKQYSGERLHLLSPPPFLPQLRTLFLWGGNKSARVGFNINLKSQGGFLSNRKLLPVLNDADACRAQKTASCLV